jgi:hypothetical protein
MSLLGVTFSAAVSVADTAGTDADQTDAIEKYSFNNVDVTALVKFYESDVKTLNKPVMIYNWSHDGENPLWSEERTQTDPLLLQRAQDLSKIFWNHFGQDAESNMYGFGLYGAVDPVFTFGYGGGSVRYNSFWVLLELQLPVGFRMATASFMARRPKPTDVTVRDVLKKFDCPIDSSVNSLFSAAGQGLPSTCAELVKAVFKDMLKIDGFDYDYAGTPFTACEGASNEGLKAFVITNPDWLKPEYIKFFNSHSTLEVDTRARIQTLFLLAAETANKPQDDVTPKIIAFMKKHENTFVNGSSTRCDGATCVVTIEFCDEQRHCDKIALDPIPRPDGPTITSAQAQKTPAEGLLWPDLEGKPKTSTITNWLKQYKFACSGVLPYPSSQPNQ